MLLSCGSAFKLIVWCQLSPDFEEVNLVKNILRMFVWSRRANSTYPSLSIAVPIGVLQCSFLSSYTYLPLPKWTKNCGGSKSLMVAVAILLLPLPIWKAGVWCRRGRIAVGCLRVWFDKPDVAWLGCPWRGESCWFLILFFDLEHGRQSRTVQLLRWSDVCWSCIPARSDAWKAMGMCKTGLSEKCQSVFTTKQVQYPSPPVHSVARPETAITLTFNNEIFMLANSTPPLLFFNGELFV